MIWDLFGSALQHVKGAAPGHVEDAAAWAISHAVNEWSDAVYDPRKNDHSISADFARSRIDQYIRVGLGWTWEPPYSGDGDFEWCGAFAAYCWRGIKPALRKTYFASTYRLDRYARYGSVNGEKNRGSGRLLAELDEHSIDLNGQIHLRPGQMLDWSPRPGDILTIGPTGSGYGKHICLVESYADGVFKTIEGNGIGLAPNGKRWQGVVRGERKLGGDGWHARRLIRPSAEDLG